METTRLMKQIALLETGDTIAVSALGGQLVGTFGGYDADDETLNIEISAPIRGGRISTPPLLGSEVCDFQAIRKLGIEVCDIQAIRVIKGTPGQLVHVQVTDVKTGKDVTVEVDFSTGKVDIDLKDADSTSPAYVKVAQALCKTLIG